MKYVSDDHQVWDTEAQAKDADDLYQKVQARLRQLKQTITQEIRAVEEAFPHIMITFDLDSEIFWRDTRKRPGGLSSFPREAASPDAVNTAVTLEPTAAPECD